MCPVCISTAVLIAGGVASAGGLAAAAIKKPGKKNSAVDRSNPTRRKEEPYDKRLKSDS
jgi:hypothetical protein